MSDTEADVVRGTIQGLTGGFRYKFNTFDGNNYADWSYQIKVLASRYKVKGILEGTTLRPATGGPEQKKFDDQNEELFHIMFNTMTPAQQQFLRPIPIGDGQKAFMALEEAYQPKTRASVKQLLREFLDLKQLDLPMHLFIARVRDLATRLEAALTATGMPLIEIMKILVLLDGLSPHHSLLREQLLLEEDITFEKAASSCILRAESYSYEKHDNDDKDLTYAKAARGKGSYCQHCFNETGKTFNNHTDDNCFRLHPELRRNSNKSNGKHHYKNNNNNNNGGASQAQGFQYSEAW